MAYLVHFPLIQRYTPQCDIGDGEPNEDFAALDDGRPASADLVPKRARVMSAHKRYPDLARIRWYWGVRERFKDLVESREPNVHQFFPIQLQYGDERLEEERIYIFNICRVIDAINLDKSNISWIKAGRLPPIPSIIRNPFHLSLDKNKICGFHVWRGDGREGHAHVYFSDELYDDVRRLKLRSIEGSHTLDE
jgi:hypothetical protein